jgi:hypothetical protein
MKPLPSRGAAGKAEGLAVVVVSEHQVVGEPQAAEQIRQPRVGVRVTGVDQITGKHHEFGIAVLGVHIGDAGGQALVGIEPIQGAAVGYQMHVGNLQELHART